MINKRSCAGQWSLTSRVVCRWRGNHVRRQLAWSTEHRLVITPSSVGTSCVCLIFFASSDVI